MNIAKSLLPMIMATFLLVVMVGEGYAAPTVTSGFDPSATLSGAVRYRNFGNSGAGGTAEIYVGIPPLDTSSPSTGHVTWGTTFPSSRCAQVSYDGVNTLTTKIAALATPCSFTTATTVTNNVGLLGTLNYMEFSLTKNAPSGSVAFNSATLGTDALGSFSISGGAGTNRWKVTNINIGSGFTLTGIVALGSPQANGDANYIEILVGSVTPLDNHGPITSSVSVTPMPVLLNGPATVKALVDDSTTGNHTIQSAAYNLDGGAFSAMSPSDGTFDSPSEWVEATFIASQVGIHDACVYGTDSLNNAGSPICQEFLVTYDFDGFFNPIDNNNLNLAKAGQAIPAKWRLTDFNGVPISDAASFVNLYSYPVSCEDLNGNILDSVEEYASGNSGLQYLGDGYWQMNWKTPKNYANTCRAMYVEFNSGALSPVVNFKFK